MFRFNSKYNCVHLEKQALPVNVLLSMYFVKFRLRKCFIIHKRMLESAIANMRNIIPSRESFLHRRVYFNSVY